MLIYALPKWPFFLSCLTIFIPTTAIAQIPFCVEATNRVPHIDTNSVTFDDVTHRIWRKSLNQEFSTYSDFEQWSLTRDRSASYRLFSLSYGDHSGRSSGSFSEDYILYSQNFDSTLFEYRFNANTERYPVFDYINQVIDQCVRRPLFVAIRPGPELTNFMLMIKFTPPQSNVPIEFALASAECRDLNGQYKRSILTDNFFLMLECRRTEAYQEDISLSTDFASTSVTMPTVSSKISELENKLTNQNAMIFRISERLLAIEERMALTNNNNRSSIQVVPLGSDTHDSIMPMIRATATLDSSFFTKAAQAAASLPETASGCRTMQSCPPSGLMSAAKSFADLENKFEIQFEVILPSDTAERLEKELLNEEVERTVPETSKGSEPAE